MTIQKGGLFKTTPLLISDKIPFISIDKAKLSIENGSLVGKTDMKNFNIPAASIHMIMIGSGGSITQQAAIECARQNCFVTFSSAGISPISVLNDGRFQNPLNIVRQVRITQNDEDRLRIGKDLLKKRISLNNGLNLEDFIYKTDACKNVESLIGIEGALVKKIYHLYATEHGLIFKKSGNGEVNKRLNILNSAFYNFTSSVVLSLGYSPSLGFIHGKTRRGALTLDIADIYKPSLILPIAFSENTQILKALGTKLAENRKALVRDMIETIETHLGGK